MIIKAFINFQGQCSSMEVCDVVFIGQCFSMCDVIHHSEFGRLETSKLYFHRIDSTNSKQKNFSFWNFRSYIDMLLSAPLSIPKSLKYSPKVSSPIVNIVPMTQQYWLLLLRGSIDIRVEFAMRHWLRTKSISIPCPKKA